MFRQFSKVQSELLAPAELEGKTSAGVIDKNELSKEDIIEFLGDDEVNEDEKSIELEKEDDKDKSKTKLEKEEVDEKELKAKDEEDKDEDEEDVDELEEIEQELEEPTEEQLELVTPVRRREILKKFPTLFKEFPYLEKAYYREQQFTELLPTIDDAKEAVEKSQTLDKFENDLMSGNTEIILKAVKNENPKAFNKIVDDYLTTLSKVDEQAYHHVIGNTIKHTIVSMVNEARKSNNEALQSAAQILNQFVFGSSDFVAPTKLSKETESGDKDSDKSNELSQREQAFVRKQFESSRDDLNSRVSNTLKATIEGNIDPKNSMSAYVKKTASREAIENLTELIDKDSRFKTLLDKLWEHSLKSNFSKESTDRIRSAYLSKAKTLLPSVIKKARIEALKGMGKQQSSSEKDEKDEKEEESTLEKDSRKSERPHSERSGKIKSAKDIPAGMRSIDFLMQD